MVDLCPLLTLLGEGSRPKGGERAKPSHGGATWRAEGEDGGDAVPRHGVLALLLYINLKVLLVAHGEPLWGVNRLPVSCFPKGRGSL